MRLKGAVVMITGASSGIGAETALAFGKRGARLELGARRIDRLEAVLKIFISTSPNLPMVASLDVARKQMATEGQALLSRTIELAQETRRRLNAIEGVYCFGEELKGNPGVFDLDPTKVTITVKSLGSVSYTHLTLPTNREV